MRIGIDGTTLVGAHAGVGRYVYQICLALKEYHPNDDFFIYSHVPIELPLPDGWINRVEPIHFMKRIKGIPWSIFRLPFLIKKDQLDIYWAAGSFAPLFLSKTKLVITVYDLNYLLVPQTMKLFAFLMYKFFFKISLLKSNKIVSISKGTEDRLKSMLNIEGHGIAYPGIDPIFLKANQDTINEVLKKYEINSEFILAVGTLEPRKNIIMLLKAFETLISHPDYSNLELVLVGGVGWKNTEFRKILDHSKGIKILGYVEGEDLPALYSSTSIFIFPSIYEGFGMPVAEARSCSARVIASDLPELREAGDASVIYIQPNIDTLCEEIKKCLSHTEKVGHLRKRFTWSSSAKKMSKIFHKTYSE